MAGRLGREKNLRRAKAGRCEREGGREGEKEKRGGREGGRKGERKRERERNQQDCL